MRQSFTKAYRPRTNGKAEGFIQTLLREWAYRRSTRPLQSAVRLPRWLHYYNFHRLHSSIGYKLPASRVNNLLNLDIYRRPLRGLTGDERASLAPPPPPQPAALRRSLLGEPHGEQRPRAPQMVGREVEQDAPARRLAPEEQRLVASGRLHGA